MATAGTCGPPRCRPATVDAHSTQATHTAGPADDNGRCPGRAAAAPYDSSVPVDVPAARESFPGGIVHTRRAVRRRGGATAIGLAVALALVGRLLDLVVGGTAGGAAGFVALVAAFPVMPVLGVPAADGSARLAVAIGASLVVWWVLGQMAAARVTRRAVAGWREWLREFAVMGSGLWLGAAGAVLLAALALGAL